MKKMLLLLVAALAAVAILPAATITCTPTNAAFGYPTQTLNCASFSGVPAGYHITSVQIAIVGSFSDTIVGDSHQVSFSAVSNLAAAPTVSGSTPADALIGTTGYIAGAAQSVFLSSLPASTIAVTATVTGNTPESAAVTGYLIYDYTSDTPEPVTMVFMGSGLLVLGVLARRRAKA